jgi:hypothetical protein
MRSTLLLSTLLASLVLASSATALAADEESSDSEEQPKPKKKAKPAEPAPAEKPAAGSEKADHDMVVGKMGVGYLGTLATPLGAAGGTLNAPIIGVRYWLNPGMGITAGLGFNTVSGSTSTNGTNQDLPAATTFALKGGVPLALTTGKHYAFVLEPQLVFGYSTQTQQPTGGGSIENSGYRFAVGATAGAEIQFGFIGIPELSLVGSVGLALDAVGGKTKNTPVGGAGTETAFAATSLATFTRENPWNIFSGNVAAIYYF